jgi:hypothetical protein
MNGNAALRYLGHAPPNFEEVRLALDRIISDGHRASEVFDSVRDLFSKVQKGERADRYWSTGARRAADVA